MHPNKVNLTAYERSRYCDAPFYKMVQTLIIADNESYILFDQSHINRCHREIVAKFGNFVKEST